MTKHEAAALIERFAQAAIDYGRSEGAYNAAARTEFHEVRAALEKALTKGQQGNE